MLFKKKPVENRNQIQYNRTKTFIYNQKANSSPYCIMTVTNSLDDVKTSLKLRLNSFFANIYIDKNQNVI